jgi:hypothetical protein
VQAKKVKLWYGKRDINVLVALEEDYARRLVGRGVLNVEDETESSLVRNFGGHISKDLISRSQRGRIFSLKGLLSSSC